MLITRNHIGALVTFSYNSPTAHDKFPQVLILHNDFEGLVHGINFNYLTKEEIDFVKAVMNEEFAEEASKYSPGIAVEIERMKTNLLTLDVKSPRDFYNRFIRTFNKKYGSYRLYDHQYIRSVRTLISADVMTGARPGLAFDRYRSKIVQVQPEKPDVKTPEQHTPPPQNRPQGPLSNVPNPVADQREFFQNLGKNK